MRKVPDFNRYLRYDPETGNLIRTCTTGNKAFIGDVAGYVCSDGYLRTSVEGKKWKNHQIIFWMHHGYIPKKIDHKNGDILCNFEWNLRDASASQNQWNAKKPKNGRTSKYKGVDRVYDKWRARIGVGNKRIPLGLFDCELEAAKAYNEAAIKYHGEFARINKLPV